MSFVLGVLIGLSAVGPIMFVLQRIDRRRTESVVTALKKQSEIDFNRWWDEREKLKALLSRAGWLLMNNLDTCGRPLSDPKDERDRIVSAISDSGAMGPRGSVGPSGVPS